MIPMPRRVTRYHADHGLDQWRGDCPKAIDTAARMPLGRDGYRAIDINFQVVLADDSLSYEAMGLHSRTPHTNGFVFIKRKFSPLRRRMTHAELYRPTHKWKVSEVKRWRRTKRRRRGVYESRVRPYTYAELVRYANNRRRKVIVCPELKSILFARYPAIAQKMYAQTISLNATTWPMTLVTMTGWRTKMKNFHDAGFETALLAHGAKKPADLAAWRPYITRVWGGWRR